MDEGARAGDGESGSYWGIQFRRVGPLVTAGRLAGAYSDRDVVERKAADGIDGLWRSWPST